MTHVRIHLFIILMINWSRAGGMGERWVFGGHSVSRGGAQGVLTCSYALLVKGEARKGPRGK